MERKHCVICKDEFLPKYRTQTHCCKTCAAKTRAKATKGKARKARLTKKCPVCGETFKCATPSDWRRAQYCSKNCSNKSRTTITKRKRTCLYCKKTFEVYASLERKRGKAKFCSNQCRNKYRSEHMPAKLERSYVDNLFSRLVRRRDGCCLYCGTDQALHCSHIISRSVSVIRADFDNAITLCHRHHLYFWHKDPIAAARWFEAKWPGRYDRLKLKAQQTVKMDWHAEFNRLRQVEEQWNRADAGQGDLFADSETLEQAA